MQSEIKQAPKQTLVKRAPVKQTAAKMADIEKLTEYWKCCEINEFSLVPCDKRNVLEANTCERCGHWQCDTCTLTTDPNAPPKEYPKPKDPETGLVRRASVSLKRAGSILSRNDLNAKNKETVARERAIAEGNENEHGITLESGSTGNNLVRRASTSIKNVASALNRKRRSGEPKLGEQVEKLKLSEVEKVGEGQDFTVIKVNEVLGCGGIVVHQPKY